MPNVHLTAVETQRTYTLSKGGLANIMGLGANEIIDTVNMVDGKIYIRTKESKRDVG